MAETLRSGWLTTGPKAAELERRFAEYVGATAGLGIYMSLQKNSFRTDLVLAAVVVTAVLSVTLFALTFVVQRLVIPWHRRG